MIEFGDMSARKAWCHSPECRPLIALRLEASTDVLIAIDRA